MNTVLKYPGSKWNIASNIVDLIPKHHSYVEPFFGSGAVLFNKPPSDIETINDLDSDVVNLFRCIRKDAGKLAEIVAAVPYSREEYDCQFTCQNDDTDPFEKAAGFLVRCWQSHGFRANRDKVGWKSDIVGRERAYAMWNWYRLPNWIVEAAERLRMVQIEHRPALDVIKRFNYPEVFQYWDPPYLLGVRAGKQYQHEMTDEGHEELLQTAVESKAMIMISGYDSEMYNNYLNKWNKVSFKSCAEHGSPRTEVLWMNFEPPVKQMELDFMEEGD